MYIKTELESVIHNHGHKEESWNFMEVCLFMPYLQRVNNVLQMGEDGGTRLRKKGMAFD